VGAAVGLAAGCGGGEKDSLTLFCGAGIRPPAADLVEAFEREHGITIATDYAGSEVLLSRLKLNHQGDLYMPGDQHYVDLAQAEGLILSQRQVCYFVPTILVQKNNPLKIAGLRDLLKPGVRLGLGDPATCAIGRQVRKIFEKNNIPWNEVEKNLTFQSATVNELGLQIQAGSLDAVIVWDAIAAYVGEKGEIIAIPPEQNIISTVAVGILKCSQHPELSAEFVEFITSEQGQQVFQKHHYTTVLPE
jgi:molybdate transport system substrate-binding protein